MGTRQTIHGTNGCYPVGGAVTFLNAVPKSFGSLEAPTSFTISQKRLWRSASVSFGFDFGFGLLAMKLPFHKSAFQIWRSASGEHHWWPRPAEQVTKPLHRFIFSVKRILSRRVLVANRRKYIPPSYTAGKSSHGLCRGLA